MYQTESLADSLIERRLDSLLAPARIDLSTPPFLPVEKNGSQHKFILLLTQVLGGLRRKGFEPRPDVLLHNYCTAWPNHQGGITKPDGAV